VVFLAFKEKFHLYSFEKNCPDQYTFIPSVESFIDSLVLSLSQNRKVFISRSNQQFSDKLIDECSKKHFVFYGHEFIFLNVSLKNKLKTLRNVQFKISNFNDFYLQLETHLS